MGGAWSGAGGSRWKQGANMASIAQVNIKSADAYEDTDDVPGGELVSFPFGRFYYRWGVGELVAVSWLLAGSRPFRLRGIELVSEPTEEGVIVAPPFELVDVVIGRHRVWPDPIGPAPVGHVSGLTAPAVDHLVQPDEEMHLRWRCMSDVAGLLDGRFLGMFPAAIRAVGR